MIAKKLAPLILLFLAACVSLDAEMQRWVGKPINTTIAFWGPPTSVTVKHDKTETYYAWRQEFCVKTLTVNNEGIIVGWSHYRCIDPNSSGMEQYRSIGEMR